MGDRVTSYLTVLAIHAEPVKTLLAQLLDSNTDEAPDSSEKRVLFYFETNYGEFDEKDILVKAGIPFDFSWEAGGDFPSGISHVRFTSEGNTQCFTLYEGDEHPRMYELLSLIDDPAALRTFILNHEENTTPLPWDNQEEYGKRYMAKQLITPKEPAN